MTNRIKRRSKIMAWRKLSVDNLLHLVGATHRGANLTTSLRTAISTIIIMYGVRMAEKTSSGSEFIGGLMIEYLKARGFLVDVDLEVERPEHPN